MEFNVEAHHARLMKKAEERRAAAKEKQQKEKAKNKRKREDPNLPLAICPPRSQTGDSSHRPSSHQPQPSFGTPPAAVRPGFAYPEGGELFVPDWTLTREESVTTDLVSATKFLEGCVPPVDAAAVGIHPEEHLSGLAAKTFASALVLGRELHLRMKANSELARKTMADVHVLEGKLKEEEERRAQDNLKAASVEAQLRSQIGEMAAQIKEMAAKHEEEKAKLKADAEAELKNVLDSQDVRDLGTFGMAWKELRAKVEGEYNISLEGIKPSIPFEDDVPAVSETVVGEAADGEGETLEKGGEDEAIGGVSDVPADVNT